MSKIKKNAIALLNSAPNTDAKDGFKNTMGSNAVFERETRVKLFFVTFE